MKRAYLLQIADKTTKTINNIPYYTTDKIGFKKWFESVHYRDEIFIKKRKNNIEVQTIYNKILFEQLLEDVDYRKARLLATNYLIENTNFEKDDYLTNDIILKSTEKENEIVHKMKWKAVSSGNVVFEGWAYYRNNKLSVGDKKSSFKWAQILVHAFTLFFIFSSLLLAGVLNLPENFSQYAVNSSKTGLSYLNFIGALTYSSFASIVRDEFNNNVQSVDKILSHNIKLEIPFWIAALNTLANLVYEEVWFFLKIIVIVVVLLLLAIKLMFDYNSDLDKYYSSKTEEAQRS